MSQDAVYDLTPFQRAMVLVFVMLSTTIYAASILISSALLPKIQGAMAATQDEVSWTMTFNIVATAVVTPMTGWLSERFGRRATMVWGAAIFAFATLMCGMASSLEELILWRIVQGAAGAPLVPLGQAILLDTYPPRMHTVVMGVFGMANMIGPSLGPTVGGEISELYGWRWGFWMIVPIAVIAAVGSRFVIPTRERRGSAHLDWSGFITLSVAIAFAQLMFSRGQRLDWFQSTEIVAAAFIAVVSFYMFIAHSLTAEKPFVRLGLLRDRNYSLGLVLVLLFGMLNFAPVVLLPPLLQNHASYPDTAIGVFIGWRGLGTLLGFFVAMFSGRFDPRMMMMIGFFLQGYAGYEMMLFDLNVSQTDLAVNSVVQGMGIGITWVPMTVVTFSTLPPEQRAEAMAVYHLLRNFGSSLFISVAVAEIVRATGANYARMSEMISPFNKVWNMPWSTGAWTIETTEGMARIAKEIVRQATMIGYVNAFLMYALVAFAAIPLCLLVRLRRPS
ncbi:MAG: DHA2 family efflux MFS transporter permease subunit [Hyphomicrobiaceae bacterium]|nr:DHA2 family efflux MFS transporter permease subunit [Hyphomicrobiaceae bacterium]